jgi:hypothetical protein
MQASQMTLLKAMQPVMSGRGSMGRLGSIKRGNSDGVAGVGVASLNANSSLTRSKPLSQQQLEAASSELLLHQSPSPPGETPPQTSRSYSGRGAAAGSGSQEVLRRGSSRLSQMDSRD